MTRITVSASDNFYIDYLSPTVLRRLICEAPERRRTCATFAYVCVCLCRICLIGRGLHQKLQERHLLAATAATVPGKFTRGQQRPPDR